MSSNPPVTQLQIGRTQVNRLKELNRPIQSRNPTGTIITIDDFRNPSSSFYNDGIGTATRDPDLMFGPLPSFRLDPQGITTALADPGRTTNNATFVICKRRVQALTTTGKYGMELWLRWTSNNWFSANTFTVVSMYNRDGVNIYIGRLWIDNSVTPVSLKTLRSGGAYTQIGTYNTADQGTYNPQGFLFDRAGTWHYVKLVLDFTNKVYVSAQFDESIFPLTDAMDQSADAGSRTLHFSVECAQKTSTRRFLNVAQVVGTVEG